MKPCIACHEGIPNKATTCPRCGADQSDGAGLPPAEELRATTDRGARFEKWTLWDHLGLWAVGVALGAGIGWALGGTGGLVLGLMVGLLLSILADFTLFGTT